MKKKSSILLFSYMLAAVFVAGGCALRQHAAAADCRRYIEAGWDRSFDSLAASIYEMDTALEKSLYSTSPALLGSACAEIYAKSLQAQENLSELPFSQYCLEKTSGFIGRIGDYARALSSKAYLEGFENGESEKLAALSDCADVLAQNLIQLRSDLDNGMLSMHDWRGAPVGEIPPLLGQSFQYMDDEFPELPTLIYDGPYSQHMDEQRSDFLESMPEIGSDAALKAAAAFTGLSETVFDYAGRSEGRLPRYLFTAAYDGGELSVAVTARGGMVLELMSSAPSGEARITDEEAVEAARAFLSQHGYDSMTDSYRTRKDGALLINFAYSQDGVICYPDLVKVMVALDSGRIVGFEADGYIMNHRFRPVTEPVSVDLARSRISPLLSEISHGLAYIPSPGRGEIFCHEFICENSDGDHYIVYVNALTGQEEKILILVEDESGTLTV